jgi:hypothetical protein
MEVRTQELYDEIMGSRHSHSIAMSAIAEFEAIRRAAVIATNKARASLENALK